MAYNHTISANKRRVGTNYKCPSDANSDLKKVSERPVAQHLEKGVVICVLPHVIQIVMLPSGSYALLRVDGSSEFSHVAGRIYRSLEDWFEL